MGRPQALLLDEPSLGLAPLVIKQMFEAIQRINAAGTTVLLAEQNAYAALKIAHRAYVMESGRIVREGKPAELLADDSIRKAYIATIRSSLSKETDMTAFAPLTRRRVGTLALACAAVAAAGPALAQEVVKIGYSGPLSGGAAQYGKNVLDGMQMAVSEINAAAPEIGGKKVKIEIVPLDDKYNPSETAINAQRLVQQHKTAAILVPHSGGIFALQTTNERSNFIVLAYSSVPQITNRGNKLTLRIPPEFTSYIDPFSKYVMGRFGKKVALVGADHDYAKAWVAAFKPGWEKLGGTVVAENAMSYNRATDFYSGVSKALAEKPDVLFVGGASEPTALAQLLQSQQIPHGQQVPTRGRKILLVLAGQLLVQRLELELAEQCGPLGLFQSGIAIGNQRALRGVGGSGCGERQGGEQDANQGLGGFGGHVSLLEMVVLFNDLKLISQYLFSKLLFKSKCREK
uniref:Predicted protein n=5 Tax=cellular organisms TaxID=131567 RepID=A9U588_PHYPA